MALLVLTPQTLVTSSHNELGVGGRSMTMFLRWLLVWRKSGSCFFPACRVFSQIRTCATECKTPLSRFLGKLEFLSKMKVLNFANTSDHKCRKKLKNENWPEFKWEGNTLCLSSLFALSCRFYELKWEFIWRILTSLYWRKPCDRHINLNLLIMLIRPHLKSISGADQRLAHNNSRAGGHSLE